jgi:hypothetical protein
VIKQAFERYPESLVNFTFSSIFDVFLENENESEFRNVTGGTEIKSLIKLVEDFLSNK